MMPGKVNVDIGEGLDGGEGCNKAMRDNTAASSKSVTVATTLRL